MDKSAISLHLALAFTLVTSGCGTAPLGSGPDSALDEDEQRLWASVIEEERRLDHSGLLYTDPTVSEYLDSVMRKLSPPELRPGALSIHVKVLKNPLLNAFAFPNGNIYVHSGMLARIESEAQLATLLGHELTHATHRHTVQELRGIRRTSAALATFQALTLPFGLFGVAATALGAVGYKGAVSGHSRSKEREADEVGLELMVKAGYSPQEAPRLFERLREDLTFRKVDEPFFFGSHPRVQDRIKSYQDLLADKYPTQAGEVGAHRYYEIMTPLIVDNTQADLAIGRIALAQRDLERVLNRQSSNARAHFLLGEVFRQRKESGDSERSEAHYQQAIAADPGLPDSHRALGYALLRRGEVEPGKVELRKYLELSPLAPDKAYVEQALQELP